MLSREEEAPWGTALTFFVHPQSLRRRHLQHPLVAAVLVGRVTVLKDGREFQAVMVSLPICLQTSEGSRSGNFLCIDEQPEKQG